MYIELEHAQLNQHMVLLGVLDRRGWYKCTMYSTHGKCLVLRRQCFVAYDYLIALTDHRDAWFFRSGDFCATDDKQMDRSLYPLIAHARGV